MAQQKNPCAECRNVYSTKKPTKSGLFRLGCAADCKYAKTSQMKICKSLGVLSSHSVRTVVSADSCRWTETMCWVEQWSTWVCVPEGMR